MNHYVLCIAINPAWTDTVILQKCRGPKGVIGRLNFPGGHVEPGESAIAAASRELFEETGLEIPSESLHYVGRVGGSHFSLEIYTGICPDLHTATSRTDEPVMLKPLVPLLDELVSQSHLYADDFDTYLAGALKVLNRVASHPAG